MLKLLMRDHSLKSKDINGKVTASPRTPDLLIDSFTSEEPTQRRESACRIDQWDQTLLPNLPCRDPVQHLAFPVLSAC